MTDEHEPAADAADGQPDSDSQTDADGQPDATPVLPAEEYVEQAYLFAAMRQRLAEGRATQEILAQVRHELLSTTRLPLAVDFLLSELRHSGDLSAAMDRLPHYFTAFQTHVLAKSEDDYHKLTFDQALLILQREAEYRGAGATTAGLFIYELESVSRNRLGYDEGLACMTHDASFDDDWVEYIALVRRQLGDRDLAELVFARSEHYVALRRRRDPSYEPSFPVLLGEREGMIALANHGKDPTYLFATLQRHLGYPEVPRPPKVSAEDRQLHSLRLEIEKLKNRLNLLEGEVTGRMDMKPLLGGKP